MMFSKIICYLLLIVIPFYFTMGWVFPVGSPIAAFINVVWIIIAMYCCLFAISKKNFGYVDRSLLIFWIIMFFSWLFSDKIVYGSIAGPVGTFSFFKNTTTALFSFYLFKYLNYKNITNDTIIKLFAIISLLAMIIAFSVHSETLEELRNQESFTNNKAYYFPCVLPLLCVFFKNRKLLLPIMGVVLFYVLLGAKRGAIVGAGMEIIIIMHYFLKNMKRKSRIYGTISVLIGVVIIANVAYYVFMSNDYLQYRYSLTITGDSSGRDNIYSYLLDIYAGSNIFHIIFGHGMNQTLFLAKQFAHQDWLELLICEGLVGFLAYLAIFVSLIHYYVKNKIFFSQTLKCIFFTAIVFWFCRSMYSMAYYNIETSYIYAALGYVVSNIEIDKKKTLCRCS